MGFPTLSRATVVPPWMALNGATGTLSEATTVLLNSPAFKIRRGTSLITLLSGFSGLLIPAGKVVPAGRGSIVFGKVAEFDRTGAIRRTLMLLPSPAS